MHTNIRWVASHTLDPWGQCVVILFLENGRPEEAARYLLDTVDCRYRWKELSFVDVAHAYNLLLPPLDRVFEFPQVHLEDH